MEIVCQQDWADINAVWCNVGAVNDHWSNKPTSILCRVMRMVPRGTVKVSVEAVCECAIGWDRALADSGNTVHVLGSLLQNTMPVQSSSFGRAFDLVCDLDLDSIAPVCLNQRAWELVVD